MSWAMSPNVFEGVPFHDSPFKNFFNIYDVGEQVSEISKKVLTSYLVLKFNE